MRQEELRNLGGQPIPDVGNIGVEAIDRGLMNVPRPEVSQRYDQMVDVAKEYMLTLEQANKNPRKNWPQADDFDNYRDAFPEMVSRFGSFCSYCERRIATNLAVEHIRPKALPAYKKLEGRWESFLLGCVNCNSTKGDKEWFPTLVESDCWPCERLIIIPA